MKILAFLDYYLPGFKAGGPLPAVSRTIDLLGSEIQFFIVTRDRDLTDREAYRDVATETWTAVGKALVYYTNDLSFVNLRHCVLDVRPDVVYLNSFFSRFTAKVLLMRRVKRIPWYPVILAPRGELAQTALDFKKVRKWLYIRVAQLTKMHRGLMWQASSPIEVADIQKTLRRYLHDSGGNCADVYLTPEVTRFDWDKNCDRTHKSVGAARFVFLGRISRIKNLDYAIQALHGIRGNITFDVYGPIEDEKYWAECRRLIASAPENVKISYCGPVEADSVSSTLSRYHFFLSPTLGENFGHGILEALGVRCPVVVSDRTPWSRIEEFGAGWNISLADELRWQEVLTECVQMSHSGYLNMSAQAERFLRETCDPSVARDALVDLFSRATPSAIAPTASKNRLMGCEEVN